MLDGEWAYVNVTFEWESEGDMPALGKAYVLVSFVPVSTEMGDTFDDGSSCRVSWKATTPSWCFRSTIAPRRCCSRS